jgi:Tfp pilus assembly major pilin PilA
LKAHPIPDARDADTSGFTLIEITVAIMIFMIALALILPTYLTLNKTASDTDAITAEDGGTLPAVTQLVSQINNAIVVYSPCKSSSKTSTPSPACVSAANGVGDSGFSLMLYLNSISGTVGGLCAQWQVTSGGLLEERTWNPSKTYTSPLPFNSVASTVTILNQDTGTTWQPPFTLEGSGDKADIVDIDLIVEPPHQGRVVPEEIRTSANAQGVNPTTFGGATPLACNPPN